MAVKSRPTLRQFIAASARYGVEERALEEKLPSGLLRFKGRYLRRDGLVAMIPNIRDSDRLTETVFAQFLRALALDAFEDDLR